ncbi:hypothetical protein ACVMB2_003503 [Sinorhizobium meliloti]
MSLILFNISLRAVRRARRCWLDIVLTCRHVRTPTPTPKADGKAERFIQTALSEWAMPSHIQRQTRRAAGLPQRVHRYKGRRPNGSLKSNTPISKLGLTEVRLLT